MTKVLIGLIALLVAVVVVQEIQHRHALDEAQKREETTRTLIALMDQVHQYTEWFYKGNLDALSEKFSDSMKLLLPKDELKKFRDRILTQLGEETQVVDEGLTPLSDQFRYDRVALFSKYDGQVQVQITLDIKEQIVGFTIQPIQKSK
ncbi:hypothetical protein HY229_07280 [Candidatus Acetothermia bacterium]|nr:hypothetical protein [Candidatus Acetothermia bacterium]MBI3643881.1 hypothetical protein [Candidatus Acetothermia bacterium]